MRAARRDEAGFSLIEVIIALALTLVIAGALYKVTRSSWLLYQTQTHAAERGFSGLRSLDDMAVEIARAGFGLGSDAGPLFPGTRDGVRATDAITLRSNPGGVAGVLGKDLVERDELVPVEGAPLFVSGDEVLLADEYGTLERAQVARVTPDSLAFRSLEGPDGRLQHKFPVSLRSRVLKVREVGFFLKTDGGATVVLARKATGQAEQILARYVGLLRFEYMDETGQPMDPADIGPGRVPGGVQITLGLSPNPDLPPVTVPPLSRRLSLEPQSATVAFDPFAYHTIGVAAVIGQDPGSAEKKVRMHAWPKPLPRF
jgi:prepilin-type N-terminal cleavage/methylation domain-containing protein